MHRVLGPYPSGRSYRLVVVGVDASGTRRRKSVICCSLQEAEARKTALQAGPLTLFYLADGLASYLQALQARQLRPETCRQIGQQLGRFLPLGEPVEGIDALRAGQLYLAETQRRKASGKLVAVDSHHLLLRRVRQFYGWLQASGLVVRNPFADVRPIGRPRRGKPQLRIDEARRFVEVALRHATQMDAGATAAVLQVFLGLRPTEALVRVVRDLDDDGQILWVPHGKTENARRRLAVPPELQPILRAQAEGKPQDAPLLGPPGEPLHTRHTLRYGLRKLCSEAGVPQVCPHSLRGLAATLAVQAGALGSDVARALGHASFKTTANHYADQSTVANAQLRGVSDALRKR